MNTKLYLIYLLVFCFASCVDRIDINIPEDSDELVVNSLISPENSIEASISISHDINSEMQISYPEGAEIELMGTGLQGSNLRFSYVSKLRSYVLRNQQFRPTVGGEYQIRAHVPGSNVDTIFAHTTIPSRIDIKSADFSNVEVLQENANNTFYFDLKVDLVEPEERPAWLHIIPMYSNNRDEDLDRIKIEEILDNTNAVSDLFLEEGIFVEMSKLEGNEFNIRVSTLNALAPGKLIDRIQFEVRSVTREYFEYHETLSRQKEAANAPFASPITNYTNVQDGLGVFAGYSTTNFDIKF